jgi:uncharacterized protein (TIGR00661 family)
LVIPLDWGLGHATRCIPLIKELLACGCEVIIAAEGATQSLLQHEFQQLRFMSLKGYRVKYSKKKQWLPLKIFTQIPLILWAIYNEHQWQKKIVKKYSIDAIIADNRFGLFNADIPTVYITHQLLIKTNNSFTEQILQKLHFWFIKKYSYCWVPDFEGKNNIAGKLSHVEKQPSNISYLGGLSRFEKSDNIEKKNDLLILISGPEPQRSIFEDLMITQLENFSGKTLLIRGLPGIADGQDLLTNPNLTIKNHLTSQELNKAIQQSALVISRSGYTTIMDLIKLGQKAILVATPGQTEQEFLAVHLMQQHIFYATEQQGFNLTAAIKAAAGFPFSIPDFDMELYRKTVRQFVQSL